LFEIEIVILPQFWRKKQDS